MSSSDFDAWFADHLEQSQIQVEQLLRDKTAVRFLIAWSLLETGCFHGFAKGKELEKHCRRIADDEGFNFSTLTPILEHFHTRYQDEQNYSNLMHGNNHPDIKPLLCRSSDSFSRFEKVFFLVSVVYRYRNNIFHGSKGVGSWLKFKPQIERCIQVMQVLITHASQIAQQKVQDAA